MQRGARHACGPYMESHGGNVELLGDRGRRRAAAARRARAAAAARRRRRWSSRSSARWRRRARPARARRRGRRRAGAAAPGAGSRDAEWVELDGRGGLRRAGGCRPPDAGLVVANVAGTLLAYRDRCAGCARAAGRRRCCSAARWPARTAGAASTCRAPGAAVDDAALQLEPVPLLRNGGPVRVALAGARSRAEAAHCELCPIGIGEDHRHLLHLVERRIICVCETCWSLRSGDPEFRPPGARTLRARRLRHERRGVGAFQIPIGLAFLMRSSVTRRRSSPSTRARPARRSPSSS